MPEGRESPDPETQTGAQLNDPPGDGHGLGEMDEKLEKMESQVEV